MDQVNNHLPEKLREAFKRKRYGADGDYDPDFDLFEAAADKIEELQRRVDNIQDCFADGVPEILGQLKRFREVLFDDYDQLTNG